MRLKKVYTIIALVVVALWPLVVSAASLSELQTKLNAAQNDLTKYQKLQSEEHAKSEHYSQNIVETQKQINAVKAVIGDLQRQIGGKERDITATTQSINAKTAAVGELTDQLNQSIETYFELNHLAAVDTLAATDDLSRINDRAEFLQALQHRSLDTIAQLKQARDDLEATKHQLEAQKSELAALKGEQEVKKSNLTAEQNAVARLLSQAQKNEAEYRVFADKLVAQREQLSAEIFTLRKKLGKNEILLGGTSGYPYARIDVPDAWGFLTRECTSYAAWKWNEIYGRPFYNTNPPRGHAFQWADLARKQGYTVGGSPTVGALVAWPRDISRGLPYGHVAIVEAINQDGTINVSEYNWNPAYGYSYRQNVSYRDYGSPDFITP